MSTLRGRAYPASTVNAAVAGEPLALVDGRLRRLVLQAVGLAAVGLGLAGVLLPLLPTTPFVLLAAWCFARSSPRLNEWLHQHRLLGPPLEDWERHRAVRPQTKAWAIGVLWVTIPLSIYLVPSTWVRAGLAGLLLVATVLVLRLDTLGPSHPARRARPDR